MVAQLINMLPAKLMKYAPSTDLGRLVKACYSYLPTDLAEELLAAVQRSVVAETKLELLAYRLIDGSLHSTCCDHIYLPSYGGCQATCPKCDALFIVEDYGVVGRKSVTDTGVAFIVDAFGGTTELETMRYHGLGTDATAEAVGQTGLITELTTEYTGNVRATGTLAESAANAFQTVATNTLDGTPGAALREHGIFSASSAGTLLDRTMFSAVTLSSGEGLQSTYTITFSSGG